MITNIKMRVTREQLKKLLDEYPIEFYGFPLKAKYIFIYSNTHITWDDNDENFKNKLNMEEVDADLFIRTNGTCKESAYPMRFFNLKYKFIVEFTSLNIGKVVETSKKSGYEVGHFSEMWVSHTDTNIWKKMEEPKQIKNNFKDYGFEADFEGEILKELDNYLIGYVKHNYNIKSVIWYKRSGSLTNDYSLGSDFNLKPIKKEWYENPDNFPCVMYSNLTHSFFIVDRIEDFILDKKYRLATKEEVLKLVVNE